MKKQNKNKLYYPRYATREDKFWGMSELEYELLAQKLVSQAIKPLLSPTRQMISKLSSPRSKKLSKKTPQKQLSFTTGSRALTPKQLTELQELVVSFKRYPARSYPARLMTLLASLTGGRLTTIDGTDRHKGRLPITTKKDGTE